MVVIVFPVGILKSVLADVVASALGEPGLDGATVVAVTRIEVASALGEEATVVAVTRIEVADSDMVE